MARVSPLASGSPRVRLATDRGGDGHKSLAFSEGRSDESSCAKQAQKRMTKNNMTNAETTTPAKTAGVGEQAAHVAPEKASSKKPCHPQAGRAQGPENRQGRQSQGRRAQERSQGQQEGRQAHCCEESQHPA